MKGPAQEPLGHSEDKEQLDLMYEEDPPIFDVLRIIKKRWKILFLFVVLGISLAVLYAFLATPIYRAEAVIAPPRQEKSSAASSALAAFGGFGAEIAGDLGISLGGADANRLQALLESHRLLERVIEKHQLLPIIFDALWDPKTKSWRIEKQVEAPDIWDAAIAFKEMYRIQNDTKLGVVRVSFEFDDQQTAKELLQHFLDELAILMQEDELRRIDQNKKFAEEQLKKTVDPIMVAKLQAMLSDQVEKAVMAHNVEQVAFEIIDPPAASDKRVKPNKKLIIFLGFFSSCFMGLFIVFLLQLRDRMRQMPHTR